MPEKFVFGPGRQNCVEDLAPQTQEYREKVLQEINHAAKIREETIASLRDIASNADLFSRQQGEANIPASGLGVLGGVLVLGSGLATIATAGATAPLLATSLGTVGTVAGVGGGAWNICNTKKKVTQDESLKARVRDVLKNDATAMARLENILQRVLNGSMGNPNQIFRELHMVGMSVGTISTVYGAQSAVKVLRMCMPSLALYCANQTTVILSGATFLLETLMKEVAEETAEDVAEEVAKKAADRAVRNITAGFVRKFAKQAAKEAAEEAAKVTLEETSKKMFKEGSKEVAEEMAKKAAKKAAKKMAKEAADKVAKKAAKETLKTAAKVTGGITACFGGLTLLWEGRNFMSACSQSTDNESAAGRELRALAAYMESCLCGQRIGS